jgi:hypothetical protein
MDGRAVGWTPRFGLTTDAGSHELVLVTASDKRKTMRVSCKSGEAKNVAVHLEE